MIKWFLPACILVYGVLTALIIFAVPIGTAPDENAHLEYVQYLLDKKQFPVFTAKGANHPGYEFHQPPLYYGATAVLWGVTPPATRPYAARFVSLFCGAATLILLWHSVRLLFPNRQALALPTTGFAALWPLHINVGASAGNDAIAGLMCAGVFWAVARFATRSEAQQYSWRDTALVGLFFGLGMLSKSSCLVVGMAGLGAVWHLTRRSGGYRNALQSTLLAAGAALVICGAWLLRNQMLYGDPLAAKIFDEAFRNSSPRPGDIMAATGVSFFGYLRAIALIMFATCWGFFGGPNSALTALNPFGSSVSPEAILVSPLILACAAATALSLLGIMKIKSDFGSFATLQSARHTALLWWVIGFLLVVLVWAQFNLSYFQAQARYLYPAFVPSALFFALGWQRIFNSERKLQLFALAFGLVLVSITLWNVFGWKTLV